MSAPLRLRVAMVWSQTLHAEHLLQTPRAVVLGYGPNALFPLPEAEARGGDITLLTPSSEQSYALHLPSAAVGAVWLHGERREVSELRRHGERIELGRGDYGVISLGATSFFFQQVRAALPVRRGLSSLDRDAVLSFGLSLFIHALVIALLLAAEQAQPFDATLAVRPELAARVAAVMPLQADPLDEPREETPTTQAPPAREAEQRPKRRASKAARRNELPAAAASATAVKLRGTALLGALSASDGLREALRDDSVGALLGGLGKAQATAGPAGGDAPARALRGKPGGAGTLLGGGLIATGSRAGGRVAGRASGGDAERGELKVALTPGAPQVSGFLSPEQINRVVRANQAALRYCYESEVQRQRGLRGKVVLQWRIDRAGAVPDARVAGSTLRSPGVEGCMLRQVKKWRFPQPSGGEVAVVYPFIFGVGE